MDKKIFSEIIKEISPSEKDILKLNIIVEELKRKIYPVLMGESIFIGGSLAKKTLIKKETGYDVDFFVLFKEEKEESRKKRDISKELENILKQLKIEYVILKGSRNYFQVDFKGLRFELVPIIEIKKAGQAKNITDISPLHVKYLLKEEAENKALADEIKLAKAFCYACGCYGAESYIKGFSGYALEVLTCHYGSFFNLIKNAAKWGTKKKIVIDPEKFYTSKEKILEEMNKSKQESPVILIDPVQKERNVCAALGKETLEKFIRACKNFIKKPSKEAFFKKEFNPSEMKKKVKKGSIFYELRAISLKDKADIAGAKLKKFFEFLSYNLKKAGFSIIDEHFDFNEKSLKARYFFIIKEPEKDMIVQGPWISMDKKYQNAFRKKWKNFFIKKNRLYAKAKRNILDVQSLLNMMDRQQMKEMGMKSIEIV